MIPGRGSGCVGVRRPPLPFSPLRQRTGSPPGCRAPNWCCIAACLCCIRYCSHFQCSSSRQTRVGRAPAQTVLFKDSGLQVEWGVATKAADLNMKTTSVFAGQACGGRQGAEGANAPAQSAGVVRLTPMWRALARVAWGQRFLLFMLALSGIASAPVSAADPPKAALPQLGSPFTAAPFVETVAAPDTLRQLASGVTPCICDMGRRTTRFQTVRPALICRIAARSAH